MTELQRYKNTNSNKLDLRPLRQLENQGRELYRTNEHYRNVATLMEHPEFRKFHNKYLNNWTDARTILMFLKLYETIERKNPKLTPYEKISILHEVMKDGKLRQKAVECFMNWSDSSLDDRNHRSIESHSDPKC